MKLRSIFLQSMMNRRYGLLYVSFWRNGAIRIIDKYEGRMCHEYKSNIPLFQGMECDMYSFIVFQTSCLQVNILKNLSCEAKVLYGLMLDRMSLSIKNRWFDEEDRAYISFRWKRLWKCLTVAGIRL